MLHFSRQICLILNVSFFFFFFFLWLHGPLSLALASLFRVS
jgi:hypothetical protein